MLSESPSRTHRNSVSFAGFTLLELIVVSVIVGTLATMVVPTYQDAREKSKIHRVVTDIGLLSIALELYYDTNNELPEYLADLNQAEMVDPWGNPYSYQRMVLNNKGEPEGELFAPRKDKFLKPLNTDYDLFSLGPDGQTRPALSTAVSKDDIIRALDGAFIGIADDF